MSDALTMKIAVGDEVRVHFHPPGSIKSFSEGVVRRVDVTTPEGRFFVLEVAHEVILDQEHRIRPGFQDYVRYECQNDFPGRIEVLAETKQVVGREVAPLLATTETPEPVAPEADASREAEVAPTAEAEADPELFQVQLEREPIRKPGGLIAALFGRNQ